jgi:hypothetical protein
MTTLGAVARFMELDRADLHEFSCDCGGRIRNADMARRIENIANGSDVRHNPPQQSEPALGGLLARWLAR